MLGCKIKDSEGNTKLGDASIHAKKTANNRVTVGPLVIAPLTRAITHTRCIDTTPAHLVIIVVAVVLLYLRGGVLGDVFLEVAVPFGES